MHCVTILSQLYSEENIFQIDTIAHFSKSTHTIICTFPLPIVMVILSNFVNFCNFCTATLLQWGCVLIFSTSNCKYVFKYAIKLLKILMYLKPEQLTFGRGTFRWARTSKSTFGSLPFLSSDNVRQHA